MFDTAKSLLRIRKITETHSEMVSNAMILLQIVNTADAKKVLTPDQFDAYYQVFSEILKDKVEKPTNLEQFSSRCFVIADKINRVVPYRMVCGDATEVADKHEQGREFVYELAKELCDGYQDVIFPNVVIKHSLEITDEFLGNTMALCSAVWFGHNAHQTPQNIDEFNEYIFFLTTNFIQNMYLNYVDNQAIYFHTITESLEKYIKEVGRKDNYLTYILYCVRYYLSTLSIDDEEALIEIVKFFLDSDSQELGGSSNAFIAKYYLEEDIVYGEEYNEMSGIEPDNPFFFKGISAAEKFIDNLAKNNNPVLSWKRDGSFYSQQLDKMIDIYSFYYQNTNELMIRLYICPYGKANYTGDINHLGFDMYHVENNYNSAGNVQNKTTINFCHRCGSKLFDDSIFCHNCGTKVR